MDYLKYFAVEFHITGILLLIIIMRLLWMLGTLIKAKADVIAFNTQLSLKRNRMGPYAATGSLVKPQPKAEEAETDED